MWLLTLIIGLIVGWFARTLVDLIRQVQEKIIGIDHDIKAHDEEEPGVVRPGLTYSDAPRPARITKLKPPEDEDSDIVRSPSPRQVALEEEANRKRVRTL